MNRLSSVILILALVAAALLLVLGASDFVLASSGTHPATPTSPMPAGQTVQIKVPLGLPPVPIPADNPPTAYTIALGRKLYYDPILSADGTISCASCHSPETGFTDRNSVSTGVGGKKGTRHSPTLINSAYNALQFWDGRAPSLEEQAKGPIANPVEMGSTHADAVKRVQANPAYVAEFKRAWGTDQITIELIVKSIASFERTVLSGNSPFDRFYYGHDKTALSASAQRGLKLFMDPKKGNCEVCHTIGKDYALFTDNKFHNLGIGADIEGNLSDVGRFNETKNYADMGAFKTPTLRNLAQRAPYMHDGTFPTLKDAFYHYIGGGNQNPHLDKEIHALDFLTFDERDDIMAFLESLSAPLPPNVGRPTPPRKSSASKPVAGK